MNIYTVVKICDFGAGTLLGLSDEQAKRRLYAVDKTDTEGIYLTNQPVQFKVGENISIDQETIGKCTDVVLIKPEQEEKAKPKQAKHKPGRSKSNSK